jgi:hypothetical protein
VIIFTFLSHYILFDDTLYYKSFEEILNIDRIDKIIEQQRLFQKISYGIIPVIIFLRVFYTSICLTIGGFISEQNLKFSQCFNISVKADLIFLFELMIKIDYFSIVGTSSIQEINDHLFSILQLPMANNMEPWIRYPSGIVNIFELIYWILLAILLSNYTKKSFVSSIGFVAKTYGIGLLLWITFITFIILNLF